MEAKHTPLPWDTEGFYVINPRDPGVISAFIADCDPTGDRNIDLTQANAALIVRAVNNHDALVSIAERWAAIDGGAWHVERYQREREELLAATSAALLAAKAGT